jgi:diguanylate cyclase (GGDEF)-like protein
LNATAEQYFALVVPATSLLLGLSLMAGWNSLRRQRYLLWIAAGYILTCIPLAAQSLMNDRQMASWAVATGALYCSGAWAIAQGFAARSGDRLPVRPAVLITALVLAALFHFSRAEDSLAMRTLSLNIGMALLLALPLPRLFRSRHDDNLLERVLRYSYVVLVLYSLARPMMVLGFSPVPSSGELSRSGLWLWMLAINLLLNLWFVFLLLGSVVQGLMERLRHERNHDPLTQLLNRRAFFEVANAQLATGQPQRWAVLACDVDHFKRINDTWGHAAGDHVLRHMGTLLSGMVRPHDVVARFGGEEFVLLLRCQDIDMAQSIAERIRTTLATTPCSPINETLTASFGLTLVAGPKDLSAALERADQAVYQAKNKGRNRVVRAGALEPIT